MVINFIANSWENELLEIPLTFSKILCIKMLYLWGVLSSKAKESSKAPAQLDNIFQT